MCPLAPSSSWVSFRWSFPVTPGGQSLRAKLPNMWAPSVSSADLQHHSQYLVSFYMTAKWNNTINTNNIDHGYCYLWCAAPRPQMWSLVPRTQKWSSESRTLSKLTKPSLCNLFKSTLIVTTKLPDCQWGKDAHSSKHLCRKAPTNHLTSTIQQQFLLEVKKIG